MHTELNHDLRNSTKWWSPLVEFTVHVFVGTGIFIIIVIPAVLLDFTIVHLKHLQVSQALIIWIKVAKYTVFAADLFMFFLFLLRTAWSFAVSLKWKN